MSDPIFIKRMAIQIETTDGKLMHIYTEDPVTMVFERQVDVAFSGYPLFRPDVLDARTSILIENLRSYRITQGQAFGPNKEIEGANQIED